MSEINVALAQINVTVGDIQGNAAKIAQWMQRAKDLGAELVCFPELSLTGYPPEDLLLKPDFVEENLRAIEGLLPHTKGIAAIVGFVEKEGDIFNSAALIADGRLQATYRKHFLPTYGVFDEDRYFCAGQQALVFVLHDVRVGVTICEDLWYPVGPARTEALAGNAEVIINISSSPFQLGKPAIKERMFATRAADLHVFLAVVNLVGGQDELVFDGQSVFFGPNGELLARANAFQEDILLCQLDVATLLRARLVDPRRRKEKLSYVQDRNAVLVLPAQVKGARGRPSPLKKQRKISTPLEPEEEVLQALILGTRDYVKKNCFSRVLIGLSGGIDSSVTAVIASMALGPDAVVGVSMPSRFTSTESKRAARDLADRLNIELIEISIEEIYTAYLHSLEGAFQGLPQDVTEENIQARIRGNILMALSNKFGWLVLTTGNKSETSVGYCTLYGDTAGGFAVLKDVSKTTVYGLATHINQREGREIIPIYVIERPPTAELREGQLDTQSLPPYSVLDSILEAYVEQDMAAEQIISQGFDPDVVKTAIRMVDRNEYKRRQSPPGIKITPRAFGKERRFPITNAFLPR